MQELITKHEADLAADAAAQAEATTLRLKLAEALSRLAAEPQRWPTFFGMEQVGTWQADALAAEQLAPAVGVVERLTAAVSEYAWLQAESGLSLAAWVSLRQQLADLEDRVRN